MTILLQGLVVSHKAMIVRQ